MLPRFPDSSHGPPPFHALPTHRLCSPGPFTSHVRLGVHTRAAAVDQDDADDGEEAEDEHYDVGADKEDEPCN